MQKRIILILEDSSENRETIRSIASTCDSVGEIFCTGNVSDAYRITMENDISLFLVDIILSPKDPGNIAGIKFVDKIRSVPRYQFVPVIIVTQLYDEMFTAFQNLHCYGYVEKPFDENRLRSLIESALKMPLENSTEAEFLYYRKDGVIYSVACDDIVYAEASMRKIILHTTDDDIVIHYKAIYELLKELPATYFVQCHRSLIVNRQYIQSLDKANRVITMKDGTLIDVGRKYLNGLVS